MSEERKQLFSALVAAQSAIKAVAKDSTNAFHKYAYASSEDVIAEARRALNSAGLALFAVTWERKRSEVEGEYGSIDVGYLLAHNSGESYPLNMATPVIIERGKPADKAEAAALTLNLAYTLRSLLLIPRGEDDAVNGRDDRSHEPRPPAKAQAFDESEWISKVTSAPEADLPAIATQLAALVKSGVKVPQSVRDAYAARKVAA